MSLVIIALIVVIIIILIIIFSTQLVNKNGIEIDIQGNNNSGEINIGTIDLKNIMNSQNLFSIKITNNKQTVKIPQLSFPLPPTHKIIISYKPVKDDIVNIKIKNNGVDITDKLFYYNNIFSIVEDKSKLKVVENGKLILGGGYSLY